ncbi:MAG: hypothetical protein QHJ73_19030, partial [Armatimonadota bacterium]|nr:hypothetical protein [Armatimonadota bacterium]
MMRLVWLTPAARQKRPAAEAGAWFERTVWLLALLAAPVPSSGSGAAPAPRVVVVQPVRSLGSAAADRQARACQQRVAELLDAAGVPVRVTPDMALSEARLKPFKVAVLPFNALDEGGVAALRAFVARGGRILAFYPKAPASFFTLLGVASTGPRAPDPPDAFRRIALESALAAEGFPERIEQGSWSALELAPREGTRVVGWWEGKGGRAGAAVTLNRAGMLVGHVLTAEGPRTKRQFLLAALGRLNSGVWGDAAQTQRARALSRLHEQRARWIRLTAHPG